MIKNDIKVKGSKILVLGITFKENCPDVRNTKVIDVVRDLQTYETVVTVSDPIANPEHVKNEYGIECFTSLPSDQYDAIVLTVAHSEYKDIDLGNLLNYNGVIYDVKGILGNFAHQKL